MERPYLHRTRYLTHYTNWGKMIMSVIGVIMAAAAWIYADDDWGSSWVVFPIIMLIFIGIFFSPVDDLAIDQQKFIHLKTSFLKFLNKSEEFDVVEMTSIRALKDKNKVSDEEKYNTLIEMSFKDGSVKSFKVTLLTKDVEEYLGLVRKMIESFRP